MGGRNLDQFYSRQQARARNLKAAKGPIAKSPDDTQDKPDEKTRPTQS